MERLTEHSKQTSHENNICCTHFCGPECLKVGGNCAMNCKWEEAAWSRLAAYEDTGLTPVEVSTLVKDWNDLCTIVGECGGISRVRVLAEADKDGRLSVLPCKVGDTVWRIVRDGEPHITRDEVRDMYFADDMTPCIELVGGRVTFTEKFGKTVFLTREEAEKALREMEGKS